jgi:nitroreductase
VEALEAIRRRRMHRALLDEPLEDAAVAAILDAALAAIN